MSDDQYDSTPDSAPADVSTDAAPAPRRRRAARRPVTAAEIDDTPTVTETAPDVVADPEPVSDEPAAEADLETDDQPEPEAALEPEVPDAEVPGAEESGAEVSGAEVPEAVTTAPRRRRASRPSAAVATFTHAEVAHETPPVAEPASAADHDTAVGGSDGDQPTRRTRTRRAPAIPLFQPVDPEVLAAARDAAFDDDGSADLRSDLDSASDDGDDTDDEGGSSGPRRRRRGRRGRGRGRGPGGDLQGEDDDAEPGDEGTAVASEDAASADEGDDAADSSADGEGTGSSRRRRRRRRSGTGDGDDGAIVGPDDPPNTVVRVREPREPREAREPREPRERSGGGGRNRGSQADADGVRGLAGSTRLEAKRQRRRDGRTGARRAPIVTEAEYLARREAVERTMIVRNQGERTQIAVLEDGVLVEHYVTRASTTAYAGNVYLGKVQNVLPSMEAAFVDIGKGRNAVLYAGEVNYDAAGIDGGRAHSIQEALKSGQNVLVQVTKDPIGQKGARLTSQITLPGRYLVYVPEGSMTGISRKLPDTERSRLKAILKKIVPDDAGVIIRTAAEGASEEELQRDVERLQAQWEEIQKAAKKADKHAPAVLHAEPDLVVRVVRDVFNEDFTGLVVQGADEWQTIEAYVSSVAPDLLPRLSKWTGSKDVFTENRVDEQLVRALDRKVHLPSGGSLVIDRTEAMTVVDVNTGKFTGKGGNLEETVTRNNLEAAEEIVRQLRLRDVGGIIVIDFIDMVLESNRDLVLRRLTECLGRDRTRHQVAEVTSLGLVQMTRKRVGTGLLEAYSEPCLACQGRGVLIHLDGPPTRSGPQHSHIPANAPKPKFPVPKPPSSRPVDETGQDVADAAEEPAVEAVVEAVADHIDATESAPVPGADEAAPDEAVSVAVIDEGPPVEAAPDEPVAKPAARRRRRATSGGPISADPSVVTPEASVPETVS